MAISQKCVGRRLQEACSRSGAYLGTSFLVKISGEKGPGPVGPGPEGQWNKRLHNHPHHAAWIEDVRSNSHPCCEKHGILEPKYKLAVLWVKSVKSSFSQGVYFDTAISCWDTRPGLRWAQSRGSWMRACWQAQSIA